MVRHGVRAWRARVCMRAASHHLHASAAVRTAAAGSPLTPRPILAPPVCAPLEPCRPTARPATRGLAAASAASRPTAVAAPDPPPPDPSPPVRCRPTRRHPSRCRPPRIARPKTTDPTAAAPRAPARRRNRRQARPTSPPGHTAARAIDVSACRAAHGAVAAAASLPRRGRRCRWTACKLGPDLLYYIFIMYGQARAHAHAKACTEYFPASHRPGAALAAGHRDGTLANLRGTYRQFLGRITYGWEDGTWENYTRGLLQPSPGQTRYK